jgi:predicted enzyme related to lactoylglutathione lyase
MWQDVIRPQSNPVVHLELHTGDLARAREFYGSLCGWRPEQVAAGECSYWAMELAEGFGGGIVECPTTRPLWLPYVEVADIIATTERARALEAALLLEPREGPAGWRSVVSTPAGGEIALWQPKR